MDSAYFAQRIRTIADWPEPGVQFRDITPLLRDGEAFRRLIEAFAERYAGERIDAIAGIDARGFIIGAALAYRLGCGFIPVRKAGKLPFATVSESYALEYGEAVVEVHTDAAEAGEHVLVIDDLIATGGTMLAAVRLMQRLGAKIVEAGAVIDLPALGGAERLRAAGVPIHALLRY
ncbi:MAG: adenine phosphoribosyltransferase [Candidatus Accumulibacter sp.]|nr:adenine phosphoribosyltransferase [Accumulibacter sp.]